MALAPVPSRRMNTARPPAILSINAGSSSLKFALYPLADQAGGRALLESVGPALLSGEAQGLEPAGRPVLRWQHGDGGGQVDLATGAPGQAFDRALQALQAVVAGEHPARDGEASTPAGGFDVVAVAHRIVHGGPRLSESVWLDDALLAELAELAPLAPLHQPHNLAGVAALRRAYPGLPQLGCFDTAFHACLPEVEQRFALPRALWDAGVRRYGFHGLSYRYLTLTLAGRTPRASGRMVLAHLGNGASLCAVEAGRSRATTMGFSATDGLMMGTRSGAVDPGVLLHLLRQGWSAERLERMLNKESGLLGVSGLSADMRTLRASADSRAVDAIALFTHRVRRECGAMAACLGGIDLLAFTGGIGEHDAQLRAEVCSGLQHLGLAIDEAANRRARGDAVEPIHAPGSAAEIWVVPTDEGRVAAADAACLLAPAPGGR